MPDLTEDEIIRDWSIDEKDKSFILNFRNKYQLWIYVQICSLRLFGKLLENPNSLNVSIIGYACKILDIAIISNINIPHRDSTKTKYKKLIFEYLGFTKFEESLEIFKKWLDDTVVNEGIITTEKLYPKAESFLIEKKILLPTPYNLKREINSFCFNKQDKLYDIIYKSLPKPFLKEIDEILVTAEETGISWFQKFKEYPGYATITLLNKYLRSYQKLIDTGIGDLTIPDIPADFKEHLFGLAKYYDSWQIKRFKAEKRYSLMLYFLLESKKRILDYIIQMHDQYITGICRECKNIHENNLKKYKRQNERAIKTMESFVDYALELNESSKITISEIYDKTVNKSELQKARDNIRKYRIESKYGYSNLLQNRYQSMRRYFPEFIKLLPFKAETGNEYLIKAIEIIRKLDNKEIAKIPEDIDIKFVDYNIIKLIYDQNKNIKRNLFEISLAIAIKEAFNSRNLFIEDTNKYTSFRNLIYSDANWREIKDESYEQLNLKQDQDKATKDIENEFNSSVKKSKKEYKKDDFANITNGKLALKKKVKIITPDDVQDIQSLIESYLPKIKIEQLLVDVDKITGFSKHFTTIHGQKRNNHNSYKILIASILAQATNIGLSTMQDCVPTVTAEMMRNMTNSCIREETIKLANAEIVNQHSELTLSRAYGKGELSSSDGQRFIMRADSLLSSYYPRYCGYYDKILGIYTHVSDQYSVFSTQAISCSPREALYVLDGLLENNTILSVKEHTTDTEGYTEHIFALCHLLGINFMPRIKNLKSQQLYRIGKNNDYGEFSQLMTKSVSLDLIKEQWDEMVRTVASMKDRLCPAHEIIKRLSRNSDKLSKAFTHLGRLIKTQYILRYITDKDLRDKVNRQLNKGEHRHALSRWIFFANQGKFTVGDYEEIMNKASCLSLVSNAVLYWNTVKVSEIITQLRKNGENISNESLSHISLLSHKHVIPMGTYFTDTIM